MKSKGFLLLLLPFLLLIGCNELTKNKHAGRVFLERSMAMHDTLRKPQVSVRVNKEYDRKGHLTRFDSTYTYSYISPGSMMMRSNSDSLYEQFRKYYDKSLPDLLKPGFNDLYFNDSIFHHDFFKSDLFDQRFRFDRKWIEDMYKEMDSLNPARANHKSPSSGKVI